ncbi:hypothetical protein EZ313_22065 [Ramlibacter henchirensis]|uniref:Uncharacterized protein n=1 Tax=Ramlibacter henchirensis TaxID=204072 RepID=A0A4Z0BLF3_9BURK|nr:PxKF domain-containing protein [Ramlibacter henchirensis]TFY99253.1 hypothetical protein EZ313_22065 [Ramlibacter henchirensis]
MRRTNSFSRLLAQSLLAASAAAMPYAAQAAGVCPSTASPYYTCTDVSSKWMPIGGAGSLVYADDLHFQYDPPFPINAFGNTYNEAWLSTNGYIYLGNSGATVIYTYTWDLMVDQQASLRTEVRGFPPNRQWIVQWDNVSFFGYWWDFPNGGEPRLSFQTIFNENGIIEYQYFGIDAGAAETLRGVIAISHGDQTVGSFLSYGQGIPSNMGVRWTPVVKDAQSPSITITSPANGASYLLAGSVAANYSCSDGNGTGVATCAGPVGNGAAVDTATVGSKSFSVSASDYAGNTTLLTSAYGVLYNFSGFFAPVDRSTGQQRNMNSTRAGQSVPVKFSLSGNQGMDIFQQGGPASKNVSCNETTSEAPVEEVATPGSSGLAYDPTTDRYTLVWKTDNSWAGTCRILTLKLKDGSEHNAYFRFTK